MLDQNLSANKWRTGGLMILCFTLLSLALGAIWVITKGGTALLAIFALVAIIGPFIAFYTSDKIVIAATRAKDADPQQWPVLHAVVEEMAIASGMPKPRVMIVEDPSPNAFATGRNEKTAVIAATTGLLAKMDREQLQSVIGHEMAHIKNRDMLVSTLAASVVGMIIVLSDIGLRLTLTSRNSGSNPVAIIAAVAALILAPLGAMLLKASLSRNREQLADYTSAKLTRNPAGMRRALETLAADGSVVKTASHSNAHLWIEEPTPSGKGLSGKLQNIFATHPPITERIEAMRKLENGGE